MRPAQKFFGELFLFSGCISPFGFTLPISLTTSQLSLRKLQMSNSWEEGEVLTSQARCESKVSNRSAAMQECGFPRLFHWAKPSVSLRALKCEGWEPAITQSQEHFPGDGSFKARIDAPLHLPFSNRKDTSQLSEILPVSSRAQERMVCYSPRC